MIKNLKMQPTDVQRLSPKITVIGVGGAGGNAVNNMISSGLEGCEFLVCNTDAQALEGSLCENKMQLGVSVTGGLGAGSKPDVGRLAAEESLDDIMQYLQGSNMAFVTAGMGGGTGTGAAPVIAKACRDSGILTVGVVTKPFHFEGSHRMNMADQGIEEIQDYVDTLIVIPNQNLFRIANEQTTFADAFGMADTVLKSGVQGVTDLMVRPGLVNLDFADIRTAMLEMGKAMMGTGEAEGDRRAIEAAESAINNPLLDDISMKGANGVIINVTGGPDMTLFEADEACNRIRDEVDASANIIFGATFDDSMEGRMRVSIVATGIEKEEVLRRTGGGSSGGAVLKRATPNTQEAAPADKAEDTDAPQSKVPIASTAPTSSVPKAPIPLTATAPGQSKPSVASPSIVEEVQVVGEQETDIFEQAQFSESVGQAQNTVMRGTRYQDSFIPPAPIEVDKNVAASTASMSGAQISSSISAPILQESVAPVAASQSGMQLNPPKVPTLETRKKAPSLFERITGSVTQHLNHGDEEKTVLRQVAPSTGVVSSPQGALNVDSPAAQSKSDDDLDIPAFLRRQAN